MRVLVTGGAGFIGSHLVDGLMESGHEVYILDNLSTGKIENVNKQAVFFCLDITESKIYPALKTIKPQVVYHLAAQTDVQKSMQDPVMDSRINSLGTLNLLRACVDSGVSKIIYASSAAVYGEPRYLPVDEKHPIAPVSFYGISKNVSEQYISVFNKLFALDYTILRYANVYGPRQSAKGDGGVVAIFTDRVLNERLPVIYGDGKQTRDFTFVKDVVAANIAAMGEGSQQVFNISTNKPTSVNELLDIFSAVLNRQIRREYVPARRGDILHSYLDNKSAYEVLGWKPNTGLREGLGDTQAYFSNQVKYKGVRE